MLIKELLDLTLREILEEYCTVCNLECGYYYGVFKATDIDEIFEQYKVEDYEEAFDVDNLISYEIIPSFDEEVRDYDTLIRIMDNLGIDKR